MSQNRRNIAQRKKRRRKVEHQANAAHLADYYNVVEAGAKQAKAEVSGQRIVISWHVDVEVVQRDIEIFAHNAYVNCVERMKHLDKVVHNYEFKYQELEVECTSQGGRALQDLRLQMDEIRKKLCVGWFQFQELFRRVYQHDPFDHGRDNLCTGLEPS